MNPLDWIKATTLDTQHKQEAATTETDQLSSLPLSQIAMDDSSPPVVHYGMHVSAVTSTPTGTDVHMHSSQQEDSYQQIIPGIPQVFAIKSNTLSVCMFCLIKTLSSLVRHWYQKILHPQILSPFSPLPIIIIIIIMLKQPPSGFQCMTKYLICSLFSR